MSDSVKKGSSKKKKKKEKEFDFPEYMTEMNDSSTKNDLMGSGRKFSPAVQMSPGRIVGGIFAFIIVIILLAMTIINVPAGYKGVIVAGFDIGKQYDEGWNIKNPLSTVEMIRYNTQSVNFIGSDVAEDVMGSIKVRSKDNIGIYMDFSLIYHLREDKVSYIRLHYGDYKESVILPLARSIPRDVCSRYTALDINGERREEVEMAIEEEMRNELEKRYIILERFAMRDIRLPSEYEKSIEMKKVAEQNVITQQYNLEAQKYIAQKMIVDAMAQRNVTIIQAQARAEAIRIVMEQFNVTNRSKAIDTYLEWLYIQALTDPNSNIKYIILPSEGGTPVILDLSRLEENGTAPQQ